MLFFFTVLSYENLLFTGDIPPKNKFFTKLFDAQFCVPECPVLMLRIMFDKIVLQQCDNFRIEPRNNFRFSKNRLRFSIAAYREEDLDGQGSYHDEQKRG